MKRLLFIALAIFGCDQEIATVSTDFPTEFSGTYYDWSNDTLFPDYSQLSVFADPDTVIAVISHNDECDSAYKYDVGDFIYLYNDYRDMIRFNKDSFDVCLDTDSNGHFETLKFTGQVRWKNPYEMHMVIPAVHFPDIEGKRIWAYSMDSKDRVPDNSYMYLNPID